MKPEIVELVKQLESAGYQVIEDAGNLVLLPRKEPRRKNQIMTIGFSVQNDYGNDQLRYAVAFKWKDGSKCLYRTTHVRSIAFDWLSDCVNDNHWLKDVNISLSVFPSTIFYFQDRTDE
jgi:hypothetical protein